MSPAKEQTPLPNSASGAHRKLPSRCQIITVFSAGSTVERQTLSTGQGFKPRLHFCNLFSGSSFFGTLSSPPGIFAVSRSCFFCMSPSMTFYGSGVEVSPTVRGFLLFFVWIFVKDLIGPLGCTGKRLNDRLPKLRACINLFRPGWNCWNGTRLLVAVRSISSCLCPF